jgi:lipopolysaccharide/colanic/teichoic acid biosynthesis glycosyltransferase
MIRLFDFFLSLFSILVLSPLLVLLWIIGLLNNGSPLFMQTRVGRYKKPFILIKFRTMPLSTKSVATHLVKNLNLNYFYRFLRKTRLDEIPQLWNVLTGEMSLVGPRPCLFNQKRLVIDRQKRGIFKVRPGITGLAQVLDINMSTPTLLAKTDLKMVKKMNVFYYFYYILKTVLLIFRKGS